VFSFQQNRIRIRRDCDALFSGFMIFEEKGTAFFGFFSVFGP
jgi:hypothetical protein